MARRKFNLTMNRMAKLAMRKTEIYKIQTVPTCIPSNPCPVFKSPPSAYIHLKGLTPNEEKNLHYDLRKCKTSIRTFFLPLKWKKEKKKG